MRWSAEGWKSKDGLWPSHFGKVVEQERFNCADGWRGQAHQFNRLSEWRDPEVPLSGTVTHTPFVNHYPRRESANMRRTICVCCLSSPAPTTRYRTKTHKPSKRRVYVLYYILPENGNFLHIHIRVIWYII